jgi:cell wall-associated NlpC family hydrolase
VSESSLTPFIGFKSESGAADTRAVRRLLLFATIALSLVPNASAADASWAQPEIKTVVEAGLLADTVAGFKPQKPLTQKALAAALETLSFASEDNSDEPVDYRYPVVVPGRAVTIRELDAALVGFLDLGDSARSVTTALRDAGLAPKAGAGTETIARLLGFRFNHPAEDDALELGLNDPATRAEAAYSLAQLLDFSGWEQDRVRSETETLVLPQLSDVQRQVLTRAVSFVGYPYVWGGTSEAPQQPFGKQTPGGFDCSGFVWRVFKLEPFPGASALASVLRGRTTYQMSGEVPPAQRIRKPENLQPGDVIFEGEAGSKSKPAQVDHAGIYLGGGWFVHSSGSGTTLHPFEGWYRDRFAWARRPLREAGLV